MIMQVQDFQARWRQSTLKERSAAQSHFNDLCHVLDVPTPTAADPNGTFYTLEKGAEQASGGDGWADVWFRGHFAWEYKGKHADLRAAYLQLLQYKDDLENPPLLVVCDLDRFEVHTNFTGTVKRVYRFSLDELDQPEPLRVLRAVFTDPEALKPGLTTETSEKAATPTPSEACQDPLREFLIAPRLSDGVASGDQPSYSWSTSQYIG
ncbi:MAG TPA: type IIL restriction-modification enzyme MmeI [Chloroflexota bacterium]|nr:type IIL restriction-modification enzyme MmeI [Chloroflexota bacterium]